MEHIFDFETLGQDATTCPAVNVAYFSFDRERFTSVMEPYFFHDLVNDIKLVKFSVEDQVKNYGYKIEKSTLEWWSNQSEHAREAIKPSSADVSLNEGVDTWLEYIERFKVKYWWTRSNTFDPIIGRRIARDVGRVDDFESLLKFWLVRDTRTYIDAKFGFPKLNAFVPFTDEEKWKSTFIAHDAVHDVAAEVMRLQAIARAEADLDIINR